MSEAESFNSHADKRGDRMQTCWNDLVRVWCLRQGARTGPGSVRLRSVLISAVLLLSVAVFPAPALARDSVGRLLAVRSVGPFAQLFGVPDPLVSADLQNVGHLLQLNQSIVNHADQSSAGEEAITLDGETYITTLSIGRAVGTRWQIGVDLPWVRHTSGRLDGSIERWHDLWGISNAKREGPRNLLAIRYQDADGIRASQSSRASGLGDIRLWTLRAWQAGRFHLATRATLKLPTGDSDELLGSGAADLALDVGTAVRLRTGTRPLDLLAYAGLAALGEGDVASDRQRGALGYGGIGLDWQITPRWHVVAQWQGQSSAFDSDLDEVGGTTLQRAAGARYRWPGANVDAALALVEDLVSDAAPDVGVQLELRKGF